MDLIFWMNFSIICIGISTIIQAFAIRNLSKRLMKIERASFLRNWLEAVENGESLADLMTMKERGFLK